MTVKNNKTVLYKVKMRVKRSRDPVFLRREFNELGSRTQVGTALKELVKNGILTKIGYGIYARNRISRYTKQTIPEQSVPDLAKIALRKLGYELALTEAEYLYDQNVSTQVPTGRRIAVKGKVSRRIGCNGKNIYIETKKIYPIV